MKKIPMRRCVATKESYPKKELIRIVRTPQKEITIDETGRLNGRGAYLKRSVEAVAIAKKTKALDRALDCRVDDAIYEELEAMFQHDA